MLLLLVIMIAVLFLVSLLPFVFPGALLSFVGIPLNAWLGGLLGTTLGLGQGSFVTRVSGQSTLTFEGVLLVYVPLLIVLLLVLRGR